MRFVITDGDRIAGSIGHMPADYFIEGRAVAVRITHDLLIDPDYRGRGLAKKIVENSKKTGDFYPGGMWMNEACYKIHRACGFDDMVPAATQTLVLDPKAFVTRQGLGAGRRTAVEVALGVGRARAMRRASAARKRAEGERSIREVSAFDPAHDDAWASMLRSYGITASRDAGLFNWKYATHPVVRYRFLLAEREGKPAGCMVWRLPHDALRIENRAVIVDFVVERGDAATLGLLAAKVIEASSAARVESLSMMTTQPWALKLLRSFGFLPRRESHSWVIANWDGRIPRDWLRKPDPWHVCLGDSDGDFWTGGQ